MEVKMNSDNNEKLGIALIRNSRAGIRFVRFMGRLYMKLCPECKQNQRAVMSNEKQRSKILGDLNFYCPDCREKIKQDMDEFQKIADAVNRI
jgi:hypothetical protein